MSRFMSGASVAVMAAFAAPVEGGADTSKVGQPERVSDDAVANADNDGMGLSDEERAQFDAMQGREGGIAAPADREPAAGDDPADDGDDAEGPDAEVAAADGAEGAGAATDGPAADAAPGRPRTVSYNKHQRELAKIQKKADDLEARLNGAVAETAKERDARTRLDERTNMLLQAIQAKPAAPAVDPAAAAAAADPEPDKEADPIGHLEWRNRKLEKRVEDLTSGRQQEQQQTAAEREEAELYRVYASDLEREAAADPEFAPAFAHLRATRHRELGFIYADIDINDPAQCALLSPEDQSRLSDSIQRSFYNEQMLVAREALQKKKSPAKTVKNLALARNFVFKPPAVVLAAGAAPAKPAAPAAPVRPVAPAAAGTVTDQLEAIRGGLEASRSLSDAGGSPGGTVTPERIANMSDAEFTEFYDSMPKNRFDSLMGKPAAS